MLGTVVHAVINTTLKVSAVNTWITQVSRRLSTNRMSGEFCYLEGASVSIASSVGVKLIVPAHSNVHEVASWLNRQAVERLGVLSA